MLTISLYHILLAIVAVVFIANALMKFFRQESGQTLFKLFLTLFVWGAILIFSLLPSLVRTLSEYFGLGSNLNTLIFTGFVFVFIAIFKLLGAIERLERQISELVRKEALRSLKDYDLTD